MEKNSRLSSFELIRILAQFFIVTYHIFLVFVYPQTLNPLHKAIWLPLHIGVILFILISGYFGIKASVKGLIKLIGMISVLYLPLQVIYLVKYDPNNLVEVIKTVIYLTSCPYWFMRTYLFLYLFSPVINKYLIGLDLKKRIVLIFILMYISHYTGTLGLDASVIDGKNLPCFLFLYVIGDTLKVYKNRWLPYRNICGIIWILLNLLLVAFFTLYNGPYAAGIYNRVFFSYSSFGLLLSSILFFIWVGGMSFKSAFINNIAKSSLVIYIIHGSTISIYKIIRPIVLNWILPYNHELILFSQIIIFSLVIIMVCIIIDNLLNPVWRLIDRLGNNCQILWNRIAPCT